MYPTVKKLTRLYSKLLEAGAGLTMFGVFLIILVNSVRRYSLGKSLEWGEQLPVFLAIYGIMFGMAWAYLQDRHVRFTILVDFIPRHKTHKLYMLVDALMVGTGGLLAYSGYLFAAKRGSIDATGLINMAKDLRNFTGWESLIVLREMSPYYSALTLGGVLLAIAALLRLLNRFYEQPQHQSQEAQ